MCRNERHIFAFGDGKQVIDDDDPDITSMECPLRHLFRKRLAFNPSQNCLLLLRLPKVEVSIIRLSFRKQAVRSLATIPSSWTMVAGVTIEILTRWASNARSGPSPISVDVEFFAGEFFTVVEKARNASRAASHKVKFVAEDFRFDLFNLLFVRLLSSYAPRTIVG
jgi:hypothetical protein